MRYAFIQHEHIHHPVWLLCRVMRVSRSGFYTWRRRPKSKRAQRDEALTEEITAIHARSRENYGAPRIHAELREQQVPCSKKRVARLMRLAGLQGRRKGGTKAKRSKVIRPATHDLLWGDFSACGPNTVWLADLTYCLPVKAGSILRWCWTLFLVVSWAGP
jgi:putative transposase